MVTVTTHISIKIYSQNRPFWLHSSTLDDKRFDSCKMLVIGIGWVAAKSCVQMDLGEYGCIHTTFIHSILNFTVNHTSMCGALFTSDSKYDTRTQMRRWLIPINRHLCVMWALQENFAPCLLIPPAYTVRLNNSRTCH